jgi:nicotinamidase-related amidase
MNIDLERTAVLGLHWLHDIVDPAGAMGAQFAPEVERLDVVTNTARVFAGSRAVGVPVVHVRVAFQPGHSDMLANAPLYDLARQVGALVDGQVGAQIIDRLAPQTDDLVLTNNRIGPFVNGSLDFSLRSRGIDTLLLTGVATDVVVETTARHAGDLGYRTIVVADCTSAASEQARQAALMIMTLLAEVASSTEVLAALGADRSGTPFATG